MQIILSFAGQLAAFVPALLVGGMTLLFVRRHLRNHRAQEEKARLAAEQAGVFSTGPQAQHPHIDNDQCIGCGTCVAACPEGDVLGMLGGKATFLKPYKCIGHGLCADACPVGAITMMMASPSMSADLPRLTPDHETSIPNLFVIGELGGLALIKNAVNQGREAIDVVASRVASIPAQSDLYDVIIVGAGPAGISASLRAIERNLNYLTLEEGEIGGTVARYPRQKLVMTSPVNFPIYGNFRKSELSKEDLLQFWSKVMQRADFKARTGEKMIGIETREDIFVVTTVKGEYKSKALVLALGKSGTPRKLDVPGEELSKVMYRLIEADHYQDKHILVVGGGDSAVEAAMGLARQRGNRVTLSYRQSSFARIKERNAQRLHECIRAGNLEVFFSSRVQEIRTNTVLLETVSGPAEIPNDFVWIFAGGTPPYQFLRKIGVQFGGDQGVAV